MRRLCLYALGLAAVAGCSSPGLRDARHLYGIHWYGDPHPDNLAAAGETEAERLVDGRTLWVLEINHLDDRSPDPDPGANGIQATPWDRPEWYAAGHNARVTGKGHSLIYRIQPNWGRNVPYFEAEGSPNNDPFTLADYAAAAARAAATHRHHARFWQVGNEVNIGATENRRWNPATGRYDIPWEPSPAQYAAVYLAVRDAIHTVTPAMAVPRQIVLMQPCSPGDIPLPGEGERYIDGNEFLWRQIAAVPPDQRHRIDGFALHAYAEPGGANDGVDGFMDSVREQLMIIDELGFHDRPVFITEFNKHMPSPEDAAIGARFVQKSYAAIHEWNQGTGGTWPGQPNHPIVAAIWFSFPRDDNGLWHDYSLLTQGALAGTDDPDRNPVEAFRAIARRDLPHGSLSGGGPHVDHTALWWTDDFDILDTEPPAPDWRVRSRGGAMVVARDGMARLVAAAPGDEAAIVTEGYAHGDLTVAMDLVLDDPRPVDGADSGQLQLVVREGSGGYVVTIEHDGATTTAALRTRRDGRLLAGPVPIAAPAGSPLQARLRADGDHLSIRLVVADSDGMIEWHVEDDAHVVGRIAVRSTMRAVSVDRITVGGREWGGR